MTEPSTARLAVIGDPIAHSKSPDIHQAFARQLGIALSYEKLRVTTDQLEAFLNDFFDHGGRGLNVTVPHKTAVFDWVTTLTPTAQLAGAVNTLMRRDDQIVGHNTDGEGLVLDLQRLGAPLRGARILLMGAGGAARGALSPLLQQHPACLHIENRTRDKAHQLAQDIGGQVRPTHDQSSYDLIIGASSAGLQGQAVALPPGAVSTQTWVYDMIYGDEATPLMRYADHMGAARTVDGLGMLVGQAAKAFECWFGQLPDSSAVLKDLRQTV